MKRFNVLQSFTILFVLSLTICGLVSSVAEGAVPQLINFQGVLRDGSGNPVPNASYSVTFTIYDDPNSGNIYWQETKSVSTTNGLFSVLLGSTTPVPDSVFHDTTRYLGIQVGADPEMTPRQRLSSVGYSSVSSQWTSAGENLFKLNGNVGIGTTSPAQKLHVENGFGTGTAVFTLGTAGVIGDAAVSIGAGYNYRHGLAIRNSNNAFGDTSHAALWIENEGFGGLTFYAADQSPDTTPFVIDNAGKVGIGESNPLNTLTIGSNGAWTSTGLFPGILMGTTDFQTKQILIGRDENNFIQLAYADDDPSTSARLLVEGNHPLYITTGGSLVLGTQATNPLELYTNSTARMHITADGNVGIGTNNPANKLSVSGNADFSGNVGIGTTTPSVAGGTGLDILSSSGHGGIAFKGSGGSATKFALLSTTFGYLSFYDVTNLADRFSISSTGNVGIGTTAPTEKLHVVGNICATGTIGACSDARFKRAVKPIEGSLDRIEKLQGVTYRWNREEYPQFADGNQIGFVTQEVKEILPEVVSQGSDGTLSVDYGRFSVVLLEAIKEQQKEIKELKAAIEKLQVDRR